MKTHTPTPAAHAHPLHEITGSVVPFEDGFLAEVAVANRKMFYSFGLTAREATKIAELDASRLNAHAALVAENARLRAALESLIACELTGDAALYLDQARAALRDGQK